MDKKRTAEGKPLQRQALLPDPFMCNPEATASVPGSDQREEIGPWIASMLPVDYLVPEVYKRWRPLVRDSLQFIVSRLSQARLASKIAEQLELPPDTPAEVRLLRLISRMPGLQKLGQVLARNRHLNPALRNELSRLENGISDIDAGAIIRVILNGLGDRIRIYGIEMESAIFAEASVSAVVRFTWSNPESGRRERGVFKTLKPHVPFCFAEDLALLRQLGDFIASRGSHYGFETGEFPRTLDEVCRLLEREVDFRREQATLAEASRVFETLPGVRVPSVIEPLCTDTITAMTDEAGVRVTDAFADRPALRQRVAAQLVEALVAAPLLSSADEAMFHADPHAGNLLYDEQAGQVVLLDWALTAYLSREQRRQTVLLALMLGLRDTAGACLAVASLAEGEPHPELVRAFVDRFVRELPLWQAPGCLDSMRLLDGLALAGVTFPAPLLLFRKALFTLDGVIHDVAGPGVSLDALLAQYLMTRPLDWLRAPLLPADLFTLQWSGAWYGARAWAQVLGW